MKTHRSKSHTPYRDKSFTSKGCYIGRIMLFRSLIKTTAVNVIKKAMMPVIRRDQLSDIFSINIPFVAREKMTPPMPDPAEVIPLAKLRFFENHWDSIAILGMYINPTPIPISTRCERYSCQALTANEAEMKPPQG